MVVLVVVCVVYVAICGGGLLQVPVAVWQCIVAIRDGLANPHVTTAHVTYRQLTLFY